MPVGQLVRQIHAAHAQPSQRLGFPAARPVAHPGQRGQRGAPVEDQIGKGASGEVGGGDAVTDVTAGPAQARCLVQHDAGPPVPRHREHTAPAVRDGHVAHLRQHGAQRLGEVPDGAGRHPPVGVGARRVAVRHAAAADRDPVVHGALGIEETVRGIAEGFATPPTDRIPHVVADRAGGDHRTVHRQPVPPQPGQRGGESLRRPQHHRRGDGARRRGRFAGRDAGDR